MLAVVAGALTLPGQAAACTYTTPLPQLAEEADGIAVAFVGRQIDRKVDGHIAVLTFEVDRVYKGEAGPLIEVRTNADTAACGTDLGRGGTTAVVARLWERDSSWSNIKAGDLTVGILSDRFSTADFEEVFGAGYPPDPTIQLPEFQMSKPPDNPTTIRQTVTVGITLVVLGAGFIAIHRRRRQEGR